MQHICGPVCKVQKYRCCGTTKKNVRCTQKPHGCHDYLVCWMHEDQQPRHWLDEEKNIPIVYVPNPQAIPENPVDGFGQTPGFGEQVEDDELEDNFSSDEEEKEEEKPGLVRKLKYLQL